MIRRDFLTRLARSAAGLYLADDVSELLLEPRRKLWPGADFGWRKMSDYDGKAAYVRDLSGLMHDIFVRRVVTDIQMESHTARLFGGMDPVPGNRLMGDLSGNWWTERVPKAYLET